MAFVVVKSIDKNSILRAVEKLVDQWRKNVEDVVKVIWFGSWTTGDPTPGSDVDICVILAQSNKSFRDRILDFLPIGFPVGIDIFPYTVSEFKELQKNHPSMYREITKGKVLME